MTNTSSALQSVCNACCLYSLWFQLLMELLVLRRGSTSRGAGHPIIPNQGMATYFRLLFCLGSFINMVYSISLDLIHLGIDCTLLSLRLPRFDRLLPIKIVVSGVWWNLLLRLHRLFMVQRYHLVEYRRSLGVPSGEGF